MYIPKRYALEDKTEILAFMQQYGFALIVSANKEFPRATHLPFAIFERENELVLCSHFAKANEQSEEIENGPVLVVFNEPHAYISPKYYDKRQNVPTWNYVAVHAYGKARILHSPNEAISILEKMFAAYEPTYQQQWEQLNETYKKNMLKGMVAFEVVINDLQAVKKLSQNKTVIERGRIIDNFMAHGSKNEQKIAQLMSKLGKL